MTLTQVSIWILKNWQLLFALTSVTLTQVRIRILEIYNNYFWDEHDVNSG